MIVFAIAPSSTLSRLLSTAAYSYLLGSIPFGYILVRVFRGHDVRESGSGNIGATNVARASPVLGVLTLLLDALKGLAAVVVTRAIFPGQNILAGLAALAAILGHMFPLWLKFRGGKGVATGLGSFVVLAPKTILVTVGVFLAVVAVVRYVSLGSIIAVGALPFVAWALHDYQSTPLLLGLMAAASVLIIAKHHDNIHRLLSGTENRFQWRQRR
jgi:glycerol-3-phosphate acyltransferase PlsY